MTIMPPLRRFDLACGTVSAVYEPGERALVALLHGNSADHTVFASQIAMLRGNGFGVLALDLPGHGLSDDAAAPATTYSFPGYADAIAGVLDALAVEQVQVAGWSLGGHIGFELMGRDERVRSLFVWGTPPVKLSKTVLAQAFIVSDDMQLASQADLSPEECAHYARAMVGYCPVPESLLAAITRTHGAARELMIKNSFAGCGLDERALVEQDPRPVAVLHGAADPFVQLSYLQDLNYRNLWRGAVLVLPDIGHAAHLQAPETFNAALLDFLCAS